MTTGSMAAERILSRLSTAAAKRRELKEKEQVQFAEMQRLAKEAKAQGATLRSIAAAGGISHVGVKYWLREES